MKRLAIVGAGELGKQILNLVLNDTKYDVYGYFDDFVEVGTTVSLHYKVVGKIKDIFSWHQYHSFDCLILAIGYNHMELRKDIFNKFSSRIPFATFIHSSCIVDPTAKFGTGTILYPGCIIDKNVEIKDNVLVNLGVVVSHDSIICSHCFIAPGVVLSGFVKINEVCFVGTGVVFINNVSICQNNIIGAGTLINRDVTEPGVYVGNPAKKIR
jgi:sugar O-acyltransferase (sialic acid O-acetyltransferase NeuD family)